MGLFALAATLGTGCDGASDTPDEPLQPESPVSAAPRATDDAPPPMPDDGGGEERADGTHAPADPTADTLRKLRDPERFRGTGSLRGHLRMPGGLPAPESWRLELGPSRTLAGREHAVERSRELPGSATEFRFDDLPLGGYDLRVYTPGYASHAIAVTLEKGNESPYVQVALSPLGSVRGVLSDTEDRLLEGREVHIKLRRTGKVTSTTSAADGSWNFYDVEPGAWTLIVGPLDAPTIPPIDFDNSGARSSNLGEQRLPVTGTLRLNVADRGQVSLPDVSIVGYSDNGDQFQGETDAQGWLEVDDLKFGHWNIVAIDEDNRRARLEHEVRSGDTETLYLTLPR